MPWIETLLLEVPFFYDDKHWFTKTKKREKHTSLIIQLKYLYYENKNRERILHFVMFIIKSIPIFTLFSLK